MAIIADVSAMAAWQVTHVVSDMYCVHKQLQRCLTAVAVCPYYGQHVSSPC